MSYILEALKKLEQKRQHEERGRVAITFQGGIHKEPGKWKIWVSILAAVLVVNAAVFIWWLGPWEQPVAPAAKKPAPVAVAKEIAPEASPAATNLDGNTNEIQGKHGNERHKLPWSKESQVRAEVAKSGSRFAPPPEAKEPAKAPAPTQSPAPQKPSVQAPAAVQPPQPSKPPSQAQAPDTKPPAPAKPTRQARQTQPPVPEDPHQAEAFPRSEPKPPAGKRVLNRSDLPASVASAIPDLKMSLHYYISDPHARFARINDMTLKEGQPLSDGLKLDEVTQAGAVMNYKGWRFLVPITQ